MQHGREGATGEPTPRWLYLFCYALMGSAGAINGALVALAIPAMAVHGLPGLVSAGAVGAILGVVPAIWLARRIGRGIAERPEP